MSNKVVYAFSSKPIKTNEQVTFKIWRNGVSVVFGVTSCPASQIEEFPQDPSLLTKRQEHWTLINEPGWSFEKNDELTYVITEYREMKIWKNHPSALLKVVPLNCYHATELWGFFAMDPLQGVTVSTSLWNIFRKVAEAPITQITPTTPPPELTVTEDNNFSSSSKDVGRREECSICCDKDANAVLYRCGHMCLCYECALNQWQGEGDGRCPLCRRVIEDVIKPYR